MQSCLIIAFLFTHCNCLPIAFLFTHCIPVYPLHSCLPIAFLFTRCIPFYPLHFCLPVAFMFTHCIPVYPSCITVYPLHCCLPIALRFVYPLHFCLFILAQCIPVYPLFFSLCARHLTGLRLPLALLFVRSWSRIIILSFYENYMKYSSSSTTGIFVCSRLYVRSKYIRIRMGTGSAILQESWIAFLMCVFPQLDFILFCCSFS